MNNRITRDSNGFHINPFEDDFIDSNNSNNSNDLYDIDGFDYSNILNDIDIFDNTHIFQTQIHVIERETYNKIETSLDDTVELPDNISMKLLNEGNCFVCLSYNDNRVVAKATKYNAPNGCVIMPKWMIEKLKIEMDNTVTITSEKIKTITFVKIKVPSEITEPMGVLEFHLRNRNILYENEQIKIKMFENTYIFTVCEIFSETERIECGILYGNNGNIPIADIKFDII